MKSGSQSCLMTSLELIHYIDYVIHKSTADGSEDQILE